MLMLRKIRTIRKRTLDDMSQVIGIQVHRLGRIERGVVEPTSDEKAMISKAIGVDEYIWFQGIGEGMLT